MAYKVTISDGTILEKSIDVVIFNADAPPDNSYDMRTYTINSMQITGRIDAGEKTVSLYEWALLPANNFSCYKEISVEQTHADQTVRIVKFSKAFVVDYSESYSKGKGCGYFSLLVRQLAEIDIDVTSQSLQDAITNTKSETIIEKEVVPIVTQEATAIITAKKPESRMQDKILDFSGKLYGIDVPLKDVKVQSINYVKRSDEEREKLRKEFDSIEREKFIKKLAEEYEEQLKEAGITDVELLKMKDGLLPSKEWQVHHKLPLDDGGTNADHNLVLIKNHPYHKVITNHQNTIIAKEIAGKDVCVVEFPIPPGNIYPPETREEFEKSIPKAEPKKKKKNK